MLDDQESRFHLLSLTRCLPSATRRLAKLDTYSQNGRRMEWCAGHRRSQAPTCLKITSTADGLTAVMDSPDQPNSGNLKVDSIALQSNVLRFEMKALLIVYEGTLSKDGYEIAGTFTQARSRSH